MDKKKLIIIGASGFGKEVAWLVERINRKSDEWDLLGFLDDNKVLQGKEVYGYKVLGGLEKSSNYKDAWFVCAIGSSKLRYSIIQRLGELQYATLIDPSVLISHSVKIGEGTIICAQTIITVDVCIGNHVIINLDSTVGHDVKIKDYVTLYPGVNVSGMCTIEKCSELGTGSQIIQTKTIGESSIIGAGAVVIKDIPNKCTAVGTPAVPIKYLE